MYECEECGMTDFNIILENTYLISICKFCGNKKTWN